MGETTGGKKTPEVEAEVAKLAEGETGGDPMSGKKWVRRSLRRLGEEMKEMGREMSAPTVGRLLNKLGFSLKANRKEKEAGQDHPDREAQFEYIAEQRGQFESQGWPIVSVDTKKKELIGDFKNAGQSWCREAERVNGHDFPNDALCRAVPYGIYDVTRNQGYVYVGISADTPEFAVEMLGRWWEEIGQAIYPQATQLLILLEFRQKRVAKVT